MRKILSMKTSNIQNETLNFKTAMKNQTLYDSSESSQEQKQRLNLSFTELDSNLLLRSSYKQNIAIQFLTHQQSNLCSSESKFSRSSIKQFQNISPITKTYQKIKKIPQINIFKNLNEETQKKRSSAKFLNFEQNTNESAKISFRNMRNKQIIINKINQFQKYLNQLFQNLKAYKQDLLPVSPFPKKLSKGFGLASIGIISETKQVKEKFKRQSQDFSVKLSYIKKELQNLRIKLAESKCGIDNDQKQKCIKIFQTVFIDIQKQMQMILKGLLF